MLRGCPCAARSAPASPCLLRRRRPPRELHARRAGAVAHAERRVAPDRRARGLPRRGAVPPHAARRGADAQRHDLCAPDRAAARIDGARHARCDGATRAAAARSRWRRYPLSPRAGCCRALPGFAQLQPDAVVHIETRTRPFLFADGEFDAALYAGTPAQVTNWAGTRAAADARGRGAGVQPAPAAARQAGGAGGHRADAAAAAEHPARRLAPVVRRAAGRRAPRPHRAALRAVLDAGHGGGARPGRGA